MKKLALAVMLLSTLLLPTGCAQRREPVTAHGAAPPAERWAGALNARDGQPHPGTYLLTLPSSPNSPPGQYRLESDRCLVDGRVELSRQGRDLEIVVVQGVNVMEIKATIAGDSFFGVYRFTGGPCKGDWGATSAERVSRH